MTFDAVDAVARGRIWSGADAAANGLVDVLGGQRAAADLARERAGLPSDAPLRPAVHVSPLERLRRPTSSEDPRSAGARTSASGWLNTGEWGSFARLTALLDLPAAGPLTMPDVRLR
jgi:protease-4